MKYFAILIFLASIFVGTQSHIRTWEPPSRSTLWRDFRFNRFNPVQNNQDDGVYCGRILQPENVVNCGVCGDPLADSVPRPNEHGGIYGRGIIAANYTVGALVPVVFQVTIPHNGSFHIRICDEIPETDACFFKREPLDIVTADGTFKDIPLDMTKRWVTASLQLPADVTCEQCVLRVNYRSGLLGTCDDGSVDYGCGLQQNFRTCSDVSIR